MSDGLTDERLAELWAETMVIVAGIRTTSALRADQAVRIFRLLFHEIAALRSENARLRAILVDPAGAEEEAK